MTVEGDATGAKILSALGTKKLLLVGCGKMGGALLDGWLAAGAPASAVQVVDPQLHGERAAALQAIGVEIIQDFSNATATPEVVVLAVKPQIMQKALASLALPADGSALIVSIAAGLPIASFEAAAPNTAVLRAMPNTPAAIGQGVTALIANELINEGQRRLGEALASVVGDVVWLDSEAQMDAVTAVSGSGPAYVFHMIEALAEAGRAEGLPDGLAMQLARATIIGAGALAAQSSDSAETLRKNVTSPGGTTAAGLEALMSEEHGLTSLLKRTVSAAAKRSRELGST